MLVNGDDPLQVETNTGLTGHDSAWKLDLTSDTWLQLHNQEPFEDDSEMEIYPCSTDMTVAAWINPRCEGIENDPLLGYPVFSAWPYTGRDGIDHNHVELHMLDYGSGGIGWGVFNGGLRIMYPRGIVTVVDARIAPNTWAFVSVTFKSKAPEYHVDDYDYVDGRTYIEASINGDIVLSNTFVNEATPTSVYNAGHWAYPEIGRLNVGELNTDGCRPHFTGMIDDLYVGECLGSSEVEALAGIKAKSVSLYGGSMEPYSAARVFGSADIKKANDIGSTSSNQDYLTLVTGNRYKSRINFKFDLASRITDSSQITALSINLRAMAVAYEGYNSSDAGYNVVPIDVYRSGHPAPIGSIARDPTFAYGGDTAVLTYPAGATIWRRTGSEADQIFYTPGEVFGAGEGLTTQADAWRNTFDDTCILNTDEEITDVLQNGLFIEIDPWYALSGNPFENRYDASEYRYMWENNRVISRKNSPNLFGVYNDYELTGNYLPPCIVMIDQFYIQIEDGVGMKPVDDLGAATPVSTIECPISIVLPRTEELESLQIEFYVKMPTMLAFNAVNDFPAGGDFVTYGNLNYGATGVLACTIDELAQLWRYPGSISGTTYLFNTRLYEASFTLSEGNGGLGYVSVLDYSSGTPTYEPATDFVADGSFESEAVPGEVDVFFVRLRLESGAFSDRGLEANDDKFEIKISLSVDISVKYQDDLPGTSWNFDNAQANTRTFNSIDVYQSYYVTETKTFAHSKTVGGDIPTLDSLNSEIQVVLDYPASAIPTNFADIEHVETMWVDFNARPYVSWFNYKDQSETAYGYGYEGTTNFLSSMQYSFGIELYNYHTGGWVSLLSANPLSHNIPAGLTEAVSASFTRTVDFSFEDCIVPGVGMRLRFSVVVDWVNSINYNRGGLNYDTSTEPGSTVVTGVENAVKQLNFAVSGVVIDLEYKRYPVATPLSSADMELAASVIFASRKVVGVPCSRSPSTAKSSSLGGKDSVFSYPRDLPKRRIS